MENIITERQILALEGKLCPDCGAANPTNEHLMSEYSSLVKASFNRLFGRAATEALNQVADVLLKRGITEIPNIFGSIQVRRWEN